ncbi:Asp23/Gls24 family envelope stress response protein [Curtobacterium sp. Csp2]|uniref:Asp23/Gls24 family envelope stress response protein n=1 Tax=Curtobacterium sp. Csp2 TaxID=2495430 RepID=UPI0015800E62|nr:Asp23/Gls24 family envelope stress response protein [Curtobacterium sp. Csp2]QKS17409.1 Asp23/Gls24 family envelope stress response protein [Curtobacterium sp. Csp2]
MNQDDLPVPDDDLPLPDDDLSVPDDDLSVPDDDLDGHSMEELAEYLDRGRNPIDPSIEGSAACRLALSNMQRLRELSLDALQHRADGESDRETGWVDRLLEAIRAEVRSGRDVPVSHPDPRLRLSMTEAAVQGIVRRAGDTMGGVVMGRCTLTGDLDVPGAPITVSVTAGLVYGHPAEETAERLRLAVTRALERHTELTVASIDVRFDDVFLP